MTCSTRKALTFVEILLLAAIVVLILVMAVPSHRNARRTRLGTECNGRLDKMYNALETYTFNTNAGELAPWPAAGKAAVFNLYGQGINLHDGCPAWRIPAGSDRHRRGGQHHRPHVQLWRRSTGRPRRHLPLPRPTSTRARS
ncbi:hypothetical protein HS125_13925 [bacterium]|nr:hypothetical protein [bacterium]